LTGQKETDLFETEDSSIAGQFSLQQRYFGISRNDEAEEKGKDDEVDVRSTIAKHPLKHDWAFLNRPSCPLS
jgi:hypothetical protein